MDRMERNPGEIRRILVIRMSAIGDIILTLPVAGALAEHFPAARIDYLVKQEYQSLVANHPALRKVWAFDRAEGFPGLRRMTREIKNERYDLILDLHGTLRSHYVRRFGGARLVKTYRKLTLARLLLKWLGLNLLRNAEPVADRYFTALADFGIERQGRRAKLALDEGTVAQARETLRQSGLEPGAEYLVAAAAASYPTKRWPAARFAEAAFRLAEGQRPVVLLGGGQERAVTAEIAHELDRRGLKAIDLAGRLAIMEAAAVIKDAWLVLANDSGLMHIADAMDRPLVAIFGPTSRELGFYPLGGNSRVVEKSGLPCRPCTLHGDPACPKGHHQCMEEIGVEEVVEAALKLTKR
jgi:lipopolysaccharide heptosyltransferase II